MPRARGEPTDSGDAVAGPVAGDRDSRSLEREIMGGRPTRWRRPQQPAATSNHPYRSEAGAVPIADNRDIARFPKGEVVVGWTCAVGVL